MLSGLQAEGYTEQVLTLELCIGAPERGAGRGGCRTTSGPRDRMIVFKGTTPVSLSRLF